MNPYMKVFLKFKKGFQKIWLLWLALIIYVTFILIIMNYKIPPISRIQGTPVEKIFQDPALIIQGVTVAIALNSTLIIDLVLDMFYYFERDGVDDRFERVGQILISIIPGYFILAKEQSPNFYFDFYCLHTIQLIGTMVPILSLSMRLLPEYFPPTPTVLCFVCFTADLVFCLFFWAVPSSAWMYVMYLTPAFISQGVFLFMLWKWVMSLLKRSSLALNARLVLELVRLMTPDELRCAVYLLFCNVCVVVITAVIGLSSRFTFMYVSLPDLLCAIYTTASFSVLSSCVPNRILQYIALKQDLQIKTSHTTIRYISHEIRSPLNIVQNGVMLVKEDLLSGKEYNISEVLDTLADVEHASIAASSIIDDLLNFEKIEAGTFKIEQKLLQASSYFTHIASRCRVLAEHKGVQFEVRNSLDFDESSQVLGVYADALRMEQVIRNLIVNSIKFTPPGGSIIVQLKNEKKVMRNVHSGWKGDSSRSNQRQVYCESVLPQTFSSPLNMDVIDRKGQNILIEITDTGVGMTKQQVEKGFGQFVQFNANALQGGGGSGLGLWICKQIIEQHNGNILLFSKGPGLGTTVSIELDGLVCDRSQLTQQDITNVSIAGQPNTGNTRDLSLVCYSMSCQGITGASSIGQQTETMATSEEVMPFRSSCTKEEEGLSKVRILVVDDSACNRKVLVKMLKKIELKNRFLNHKIKFDFQEADDGLQALRLVGNSNTSEAFHVVFIDNIMINMNGPETVELMRKEHFQGKIIGVTGNSLNSDIQEFQDKGADLVFIKPVKWESLCDVMASLIAIHNSPSRAQSPDSQNTSVLVL